MPPLGSEGQGDPLRETDDRRGSLPAPGAARNVAPSGREKPSWSITKLAATGTIVLRFVGPTRTWEIAEFLSALTEMMPPEDANIIFDLRQLVGHNPETKQPLKTWLIENRGRIGQVTVVLPKAAILLKMATAVIGLASGVKIKVRDDLDAETLVAEL